MSLILIPKTTHIDAKHDNTVLEYKSNIRIFTTMLLFFESVLVLSIMLLMLILT